LIVGQWLVDANPADPVALRTQGRGPKTPSLMLTSLKPKPRIRANPATLDISAR